jgi:glycosyltransferase involved in cell wall biosynthesis
VLKKIKVLHLIKTLNLGGAETNLYNLVTATDAEKFDVHVGYSYGGEIEARFRGAGVELFKFAENSYRVKSLATIGIVYKLARYVRQNKIDIVHTHNFNAHVWGSLAAKLSGAKIVEHVHDFRYLDPAEFAKRRGSSNQYKYIKYFKNISDCVIVLTKQNYDYLVRNNLYDAKNVREIQNGIPFFADRGPDTEIKKALAEKFGIPEGARVVLTPARVAPEKNIDLVLQIAPRVLAEVPETVFVISGDGPLLEEYRTRVTAEGLEGSVKFIGFYQEMYDLLSLADVFLLPSFLELHSIAILEAMSMKVPVVVSSGVGCNDEFITNGTNGILLDPFGEKGWAEAVAQLLKDPVRRETMGKNGYETCRSKFNILNVAKAKESVYAELVSQ